MTTKIRTFTRPPGAARTLAAPATLAVLLVPALFATADNATDHQCLAPLHHGGQYGPTQPDKPICFESPIMAINTGKMIGQGMTQTGPYTEFQLLNGLMYEGSRDRGPSKRLSVGRDRRRPSALLRKTIGDKWFTYMNWME